MSTAVLRRYTPPTCTLEIVATGSALSRWTDRQVLKNLRFRLSFDDPALPSEQQVQIRGDRPQLEALCDAVSTYVQQILEADAPRTMPALLRLSPDTPPLVSFNTTGSAAKTERTTLQDETAIAPPAFGSVNGDSSITAAASNGIALHPRGLLSHELHLGSLGTPGSGPILRLSTTQLFDLANSLDSYTSDAVALPTLAQPAWSKPAGALKAAAALVLAVGATATLARFVTSVSQTAPMATSAPEVSSTAPPAPATVPGVPNQDLTPLPPPPAGSIATQPFPSPTALPGTVPGVENIPVPVAPPGANALPPNPVLPSAPAAQPMPAPPTAIARAPQAAPQPAPANAPFFRSAPSTLRAPTAEEFVGSGAAPAPEAGIASTDAAPSAIARSNQSGSIPQLQEVQDYFRQRWQPPGTLDQALEYRLVVAPDGTIARIVPLGQLSGDFVDRTGIPLVGDPFVSPLSDGKTALIRLVLSPDGQVQAFLEGLN